MSLTTASQISHRARCARAASVTLASSQTRNFRFGFRRVWSLDPEVQHETCRRQRTFRFKYTEPTNPRADDAKSSLKSAIHSYWAVGGRARIHLGRYADPEAVQTSENNAEGARPGQNIEDVERSPMESLLFGNQIQAESPDYIIDPITNRKVPKSSYGGVNTPSETFKSYRSQFVAEKPQAPIFYDGAPPEAELAKYDQVQIDAEPWDPASRDAPHQTVPQSTPSWSYRGVSWHRNDGIVSSAGSSVAFWHDDPSPAELEKYKPVLDNVAEASAAPSPPAQSYTDLGDYKAVRAHEPDGKYKSQAVADQEYDDLDKYGAVRAHEPDGKYKPQAVANPTTEYDDLHKYGAVRAHEPDGKYKPQAVVDKTLEYDDLDKYTAVRAHEPDGKYKVHAVQDPTQEYEDLDKYNAVRAHEPDGKYKVHAVQDPTEEYDDLHKYGAVRAHEPDGKYKVRDVQDPTQEYDDLHTYQAFRSHEPDGKYKIEAVAVKPEELSHLERDPCLEAHESETFKELVDENPAQQYEDLDKYGPVRAHEPDGMYKVRDVQDPTEEYDDLHKYGAYRSHEPDGKYKVQAVEDPTQEYDDLHKYTAFRSHEPDGKYAASYVEPKKPKDLKGYGAFRSHEPDGKYAASYVEPAVNGRELGSYKAYRSHEPDGKYAESYKKPEDGKHELGGYQAFRSHEPDGKYAAEQQRPDIDQAELGTYKAYLSHEPDGKYAANHQPEEVPEDLKAYGAFRSHEPDGKYAPQASTSSGATPSSPTSGMTAAGPPKYGAVRHYERDGTPLTEPTENPSNPAELGTCQAVPDALNERSLDPMASDRVSELRAKTNYREMLESLMARIAAEYDAEDMKAAAVVKRLKEKAQEDDATQDGRSLTGSYVRDFPEEFSRRWSVGQSSSPETLLPADMERMAQKEEREPANGSSFATASVPLQPALDRQARRRGLRSRRARQLVEDDPYSHEPQGLQTSYADEIGSQVTWPTLVKHYGSVKPAQPEPESMSSSEAVQKPPAEPTLYKILAYDPLLQTVDVAETTSVVPDQAAPLSPAEVLLRITNPSRFLPHFAPLQAQGFEIVAGSGQVLIFRKVRPAVNQMVTPITAGSAAPSAESGQTPLVNPIDMTGGEPELPPVAAARYASPTGFVNYDLPGSPSLRFVSGIDVRREEPVFSGQKTGEEDKDQRKLSLPKRMAIGAVFLGGAMYSVGVVGEYFRTGGSDGKGPQGF